MTALIDADIVAFRAAASANNDPEEIAILRCDKTMRDILNRTGETSYAGYLTGGDSFRKVINPEYKANRKDVEPPVHLQACREFLVREWKCLVTVGHEADDALGVDSREDTILCSIDKDLNQIPGWHYNWVQDVEYEVTGYQGFRHFWAQMLIGDVADNLQGVRGIGEKKAAKLLNELTNEQDMFRVVLEKYDNDYKRFLTNGTCFYIWQSHEKVWLNHLLNHFDLTEELRLEAEALLKSMKSLMEDI